MVSEILGKAGSSTILGLLDVELSPRYSITDTMCYATAMSAWIYM